MLSSVSHLVQNTRMSLTRLKSKVDKPIFLSEATESSIFHHLSQVLEITCILGFMDPSFLFETNSMASQHALNTVHSHVSKTGHCQKTF